MYILSFRNAYLFANNKSKLLWIPVLFGFHTIHWRFAHFNVLFLMSHEPYGFHYYLYDSFDPCLIGISCARIIYYHCLSINFPEHLGNYVGKMIMNLDLFNFTILVLIIYKIG